MAEASSAAQRAQLFFNWEGSSTFAVGNCQIRTIELIFDGKVHDIRVQVPKGRDQGESLLPFKTVEDRSQNHSQSKERTSTCIDIAVEQIYHLTLRAHIQTALFVNSWQTQPVETQLHSSVEVALATKIKERGSYVIQCRSKEKDYFALEASLVEAKLDEQQMQTLISVLLDEILLGIRLDVAGTLLFADKSFKIRQNEAFLQDLVRQAIQRSSSCDALSLFLSLETLRAENPIQISQDIVDKLRLDKLRALNRAMEPAVFLDLIRTYLQTTLECEDQEALDQAIQEALDLTSSLINVLKRH